MCEHVLDTTDLSPAATHSCASYQPGVVPAAPVVPAGKRVACDRGVLVSAADFQTQVCVGACYSVGQCYFSRGNPALALHSIKQTHFSGFAPHGTTFTSAAAALLPRVPQSTMTFVLNSPVLGRRLRVSFTAKVTKAFVAELGTQCWI